MNELDVNLAQAAGGQLVPVGFAEKAMASLMQLHTELVDEKEKRVALYRTLMEKEQSLAELAMYVRVLEERLGQPPPLPPSVAAPRPPAVPEVPKQQVAPKRAAPEARMPPGPTARPGVHEGWKVW
jgi:hypothetical protein